MQRQRFNRRRKPLFTQHIMSKVPSIEQVDSYTSNVLSYGERISGGQGAVDRSNLGEKSHIFAKTRKFPTQTYESLQKPADHDN